MPDDVQQWVADLARDLANARRIDDAAEIVVAVASDLVGTDHAGLTLINPGRRFETFAATRRSVVEADHLQYSLKEGPCVDAATEARSFISPDLANDERWPTWGPAAVELGFRSMLAVDLFAREQRIGAINLYGDGSRDFDEADLRVLQSVAPHAAAAISSLRTEEGLIAALDSRVIIGQAQGVLMERYSVDADRAFQILRRFSQSLNVKLRDVAARIVDGTPLDEMDVPEILGSGEDTSVPSGS
ncbi:ANTAR domain protein [Aeromicrobium marinum DSM 15272]|uniref:ANTAR domain protein n=1 Tax=Aeromicrobium marinum DSM 15272 TaxID=585531 RepID=E2S7X3_9ACTN|nr:GAF and ANTAR domain-containing protein [Aeromicrobium marinum]EFQ84789.1 ANTAR domain protein [Aeromicrobium marinum DSM 15272]